MSRLSSLIVLLLAFLVLGCTQQDDSENAEKVINWDGNVFLRGTFNNWDFSAPFKKDVSSFYAEATLKKGRNEFKVGTKDWVVIDLGSGGTEPLQAGIPYPLTAKGGNIVFNLEDDKAPFVFTVSGVESEKPVLKIVRGRFSSYE